MRWRMIVGPYLKLEAIFPDRCYHDKSIISYTNQWCWLEVGVEKGIRFAHGGIHLTKLYPSEVVTLGILFALKGKGCPIIAGSWEGNCVWC